MSEWNPLALSLCGSLASGQPLFIKVFSCEGEWSMRRFLACLSLVITGVVGAAAQSGSNGVYGGYVGSSRWFSSMRQSAQNMAMRQQLGGGTRTQPVPPDYVEVAGEFTFPQGNPFPNGRLPDLRIKCDQPGADSVERAPSILRDDRQVVFYTVLRKGYSYSFQWMYYFGSKETFAAWSVPGDSPMQVTHIFPIDGKGHGPGFAAPEGSISKSPESLQSDHNYRPPQSDGAWHAPQSDHNYKAPQSSNSNKPSSKPVRCNPNIPRYSQPSCVP